MTVADHPVVSPDASRHTLPSQLSPVASNFKAIVVPPCFRLLAHETEECHVHRFTSKQEGFKMETEVLAEAIEKLPTKSTKGRHHNQSAHQDNDDNKEP